MSIFVTSKAWMDSAASGSTLLVLLAICDFADDKGVAFPSVKTLAKKARLSERTTQYALRELIKLGELVIERGAGPKGCNEYRVLMSAMKASEAVDNSAQEASKGGVQTLRGVQSTTEGGATHCTQTVIEPSLKKKESAGAGASHPAPVDNSARQTIAFDTETGGFTGISDSRMHLWATANPDINVATELVRAGCWLLANPERQKSNYARFLTNWLAKASARASESKLAAAASANRPRQPTAAEQRAERNRRWAEVMCGQRPPFAGGDDGVIDV